jgi:hypothetical protein
VANKISNPAFETGPGHFYPWFRDGNAQIVGDESCCGQHETFFWPDGAAHPNRSGLFNDGDTWDGFIYNQNRPGTQYGALAQNLSITAGQRYRLSAWMATSNGNTAYLRWYANGVTNLCAQTNGVWPGQHVIWPTSQTSPQTSLNVSCEFTPSNVNGFNVQMAANVSTGQWVVSDDWALTPLFTVPVYPGARLPRPIKYWARDYGNSVDRAANSWNAATGQTLFVKASSEADAKLIIDGVDTFCDPGLQNGDNGVYAATYDVNDHRPQCNVGVDRELIQLNMWYFGRWSGDPKQSTIAHELGHALGLFEIDTYDASHESCQIGTSSTARRYYYCGVVQPTSRDASSVPYP